MPSPHSETAPIRFSVVIPVYGNEATIEPLIVQLASLALRLDGHMEAVFVVDGSPDHSYEILKQQLHTAPFRSQLVAHSRNFGSFPAIRTGLGVARGDFIGVMAADLQESPELMVQFFDSLADDKADVVIGRREARADPAMSSLGSRLFWWLYRSTINPQIPPGGVDVFGCTRDVAARLLDMCESHSSLVGLLFWVGYRRVEVPYRRLPRPTGSSGWTFRKRVGYLMDSVFSFTAIPITMLTVLGSLGVLVTTIVGIVVFISWATGRIMNPGYTPIMLVILLSTFLILGGLGIVGAYVYRAFENTKNRPIAIAMSVDQFDGEV